MWARSANPGERGYSLLHCRTGAGDPARAPELVSPRISASLITQERDGAIAGQWYSDRTYFYNLSLTGRPVSARGRFEGMAGAFRPVGDLFFLPVGRRYHARGGPGRQKTLFFEIDANIGEPDGFAFPVEEDAALQACLNLRYDRLRDLLIQIAREVETPGFASTLLLEGLGLSLLAETLRVLKSKHDNAARRGGLPRWRIRAIEERVRDDERVPTLSELAELCGLGRRQLMRAFREETGQTVGTFVQNLVIERAKTLLRDTDLPVAQIASRAGFASTSAFSTAFRRSAGETPRTFRLMRRTSAAA